MKKVLLILLFLVIILAIIPLFLPKTLHVEDEYVYDASTESVYDYFYDMKKFTQFDAWSQMDPNIKIDYSTPSSGVDASYSWESEDKNLGKGSMTITNAKANQFVNYDLKFGKMEGNTAEAIFQKMDDGKTKVIWSFDSAEAGYPFQVFNILMEGTVKNNLHKGLVNLDSLLQKSTKIDYANTDITKGGFQLVNEPAKKLFGVLQQTSTSDEEMATAMGESFGLINSYLIDANGFTDEQIGKPVVLWKQYDTESNSTLFYCGFFLDKDVAEREDMEFVEVPAGKMLTTIHNGAYNTLGITYNRMLKFAEVQNLELSTETYDIYLNDPANVEEDKLQTQIFIPVLN